MRLTKYIAILAILCLVLPLVNASQIFVTGTDTDKVGIFDTVTENFQEKELLGGPGRVARLGDNLIIAMTKDNSIVQLNLNTLEEEKRINVGRKPHDLVVFNNKVYVTLTNDNQIAEVDLADEKVSRILNVGKRPLRIAVLKLGENYKLLVGAQGPNNIDVVDVNEWTVENSIDGEFGTPGPLSVSPDNSKIHFVDMDNQIIKEVETNTFSVTPNTYETGRVTSDHDLITGNKFALLSSDVGSTGEIQLSNFEDGSSLGITLSRRVKGLDLEKGVIYASTDNSITMVNKETNIQKEFEIPFRTDHVKVIDETYVPIGDIDFTEDLNPEESTSTQKFPWKRVSVLVLILIVLAIFARRQSLKEEEENYLKPNAEFKSEPSVNEPKVEIVEKDNVSEKLQKEESNLELKEDHKEDSDNEKDQPKVKEEKSVVKEETKNTKKEVKKTPKKKVVKKSSKKATTKKKSTKK